MTAPQAYQTTELVHCQDSSSASDVFAFAIAMWECFSYGQTPWRGMTNDQVRDCPRGNRVTEEDEEKKISFCLLQIINRDNSANHQRLSRPPYATSELYQIMLLCWKYEPSERPTFSQLEKALADVV